MCRSLELLKALEELRSLGIDPSRINNDSPRFIRNLEKGRDRATDWGMTCYNSGHEGRCEKCPLYHINSESYSVNCARISQPYEDKYYEDGVTPEYLLKLIKIVLRAKNEKH